ncbi:hypothetical protein HYX70_00945 [Candidatus Saccharibacteria bacterium]|nr:hypothetical protein [Candidatus Saccharibacteria bacterium]
MFKNELQNNTKIFLTVLAAGVMLASFYFVNSPVSNIVKKLLPGNSSSTTQNEQPNEPQQNGGQTNQATTPSQSSSASQTASCNVAQKASFTAQYSSQVNNENARYDNQTRFIETTISDPNSRQAALSRENSVHNANLNSINSQYQSNLRSINC